MLSDSALELREGETDRFYFLFASMLATGDAISASPAPAVTSTGPTISNVAKNSAPLTLDGVEYATDTVVYFDASAARQGDNAECLCNVTTNSGRVLKSSLWIKTIDHYAD